MTCIVCEWIEWIMNGHDENTLYTTGVVYKLKSHCNPSRASNSPDSSHSFHSTANSSFPAKITWCNLHAPSRCRGWWMPTIHTRPSQIQHKSTFIAGDTHYVLFYKISFCTDPVNLFGFGFNVSAERNVYCLVFTPYYLFLGYCYTRSMFHVCFILLRRGCRSTESEGRIKSAKFMAVQGTASNHNLLYSNL